MTADTEVQAVRDAARARMFKRKGPVRLEIPMLLESVLFSRFGLASFAHIHDSDNLGTWRKSIVALFDSFDRAIRDTVVGDEHHKASMRALCRAAAAAAKGSKTKEKLVSEASGNLAALCFELLGGMSIDQVQMGQRKGAKWRNWSFARYRSVFYASTAEQMLSRILDYARWGRERGEKETGEKLPEEDQLWERRRSFRDASDFVDWFRREYPRTYATLF
jgi:hypothetical protein